MTFFTKVGVAKKGTSSLRTTIPEGIVEYLKLEAGNKLQWNMEIKNGTRYVELRARSYGSVVAYYKI